MSLFRGKAPPPAGGVPAAAAAAAAASAGPAADRHAGAPGGNDGQEDGDDDDRQQAGGGGEEAKGTENVRRRKRKRAAGSPSSPAKKEAALHRRRGSAEEPLTALQRHRRSLPVFDARNALLHNINKHSTVIIVGETGSGKTTQIPQYIVEAGPAGSGGVVGVTQPRRVAAVSLAHRVAEEMGTTLGRKVGYSVRFKSVFSPKRGVLKFLTDGMLLRELLVDPLLSSYSTIVLDEAHERSVRTDLLFGMVKSVQKQRKEMIKSGVKTYPVEDGDKAKGDGAAVRVRPLKIVVMSATLDCERFSEYFDGAPVLYISGRQHPVRIFNAAEPQPDYLDAALVTVFQIHADCGTGDILVFLAGQEEIESLASIINEQAATLPPEASKILVCPIFAALPTNQQAKVFEPAPPGTRKVILATNIAETSITISGVKYVVDTGVSKMRAYNPKLGIESLTVQPISRASARQRAGRAGREMPGFCYRLYTEDSFFDDLPEDTEPEIRRCNLASVILLLKAAGVDDPVSFDFMDKPSRESLERALEELYALEAIEKDGGLSSLGRLMAEFPIDPTFGKTLIKSQELGCTAEVIDVIALLSVDSVFYMPNDRRDEASEARRKFVDAAGDHLTMLSVLRAYQQVRGEERWCRDNFVNIRNMKHALDIRKQLAQLCVRRKIDPTSSCGHDSDLVLKAFLAGFFQHTALLQPDSTYRSVVGGRTVSVHPTSVLFGKKVAAIMYNEIVLTTKQYVRGVSAIQSSWLSAAAPKYFGNV